MIRVTFYTLVGAFAVAKKEEFANFTAAEAAVRAFAEPAGFSNFRRAHDEDEDFRDQFRIVADPKTGRKGRNVATVEDMGFDDDDAHAPLDADGAAIVAKVIAEMAADGELSPVALQLSQACRVTGEHADCPRETTLGTAKCECPCHAPGAVVRRLPNGSTFVDRYPSESERIRRRQGDA